MRKVLIVQTSIRQYRKEFYEQLRQTLLKNDIELILITSRVNGAEALKNDEVEISWSYIVKNRTFKVIKLEFVWQTYLGFIKDVDLIIVENANKHLMNYFLAFYRHFAKFKFAYWGHGRNFKENTYSLKNRFKYFFATKVDWWFAYTSGVKQFLVERKFNPRKITVVQNAIDTSELRKSYLEIKDSEINHLKETLSISGDNVGIFCGAMYPERNISFVIEVCKIVQKKIPDFHVIFIGSGIDAVKVQKAARYNNWIHYIGSVFGLERVKYFKISNIQIMPFSVGLGVLDSFATETPLITIENAFHGPEIDYLENGVNGIITKNNFQEYSSAIINVFKNDRYKELKEGCKFSARKYTIQKMVNNFKQGIIFCLYGFQPK